MSAQLPTREEIREGHENSEVGGYGFLIFAILFVTGLGSMSLFLIWLLRSLAAETPAEPSSALALRLRPQGVQLQSSIIHPTGPREDLVRLRAHYQKMLDTYGWIDQPKQLVRIPVNRAMQIYLERGSPAAGIAAATRPGEHPASAPAGGAR